MSALAPTDVLARRTVIVDDTADLRELLTLALSRHGFDVVGEAPDGRSGIELVERVRPDLVLLDLSMPVMDGLEALPAIRALVPDATVVVLSGFGAAQMAGRALAAGADGYVQKGASLGSIVEYLDGLAREPGAVPRALGRAGPAAAATPAATPAVTPAALPADPRPGGRPAGATLRSGSARAGHELAPYGVLELSDDPLLRVLYLNPAAAHELDAEPVAGTALAVVSPALATRVEQHRAADDPATFLLELESGRSLRVAVRRTGWSVLVYLDALAEDVTVLRRAVALTAQELRGPVNVLTAITGAWSADLTAPERDRMVRSVASQARLVDALTADLLTAAQEQRGTLRVELRDVDPLRLVRRVVAAHPGVELVADAATDGPGGVPAVRADPDRLEQMLGTLLANAGKHGAPPVGVTLRSDGGHLCLDVADAGPGVPDAVEPLLFDELAHAGSTAGSGSGLGLYVVGLLARAQGGSVSYRPGDAGGAVFTVRLPTA